jgi:signal transduction histidine kinase
VVANVLRDLWGEPAPPERPARTPIDRITVALLVGLSLADGLTSAEVGWPTISIPLMMALPIALFWRTTHLLATTGFVFGVYAVLHGAMLVAGVPGQFLNGGLMAVVVYSLARWGSGPEAAFGFGLVAIGAGVAGSTGVLHEPGGIVGLPLFIGLIASTGIAVRLWSSRAAARLSETKMVERNRIARELHDTVAHHVSAIAVQAQGAQEILHSDTDAAAAALSVIEKEASLTLAEMRLILGVLRDDGPAALAPQPGIDDIARLAQSSDSGPAVDVDLSGDLDHLSPSIGAGLFRMAQEAVTNARRHAQQATHVGIRIVGSESRVEMTVIDNGGPSSPVGSGYGLLGMAERATLLGGEVKAGPAPDGGWVVKASLPRTRASS